MPCKKDGHTQPRHLLNVSEPCACVSRHPASAASPLTSQAGWAAGREGAAEATVRPLLRGFLRSPDTEFSPFGGSQVCVYHANGRVELRLDIRC